MYSLVVITQPGQTPIHLSVREPIEMGRECSGLLLADPQVSRRHLLLDPTGGTLMVSDLGSTNGSFIDGQPLNGPTPLTANRRVLFGETTVQLVVDRVGGVEAARGTLVSNGASGSAAESRDPKGTVQAAPGRSAAGAARGAGVVMTPHASAGADPLRQTSIDAVAASATSDGIDVSALAADQGTVTIVFSDIESSTDLNVSMGDQAWFDLLGVHNKIVSDRVNASGGTIIKNAGDGFMMSFPGARRALDCMSAIQRDLARHSDANPDRAIKVRMGLHTGEVLADSDGDLFGTHVVVAARVANLADGGEILVSSLTREIIVSRGDITFGTARNVTLKGIGDAVVYPYDWSHS